MKKITIDFIVDDWMNVEDIGDALRSSISFTKDDIINDDEKISSIIRDSSHSIDLVKTGKMDRPCLSIRAL